MKTMVRIAALTAAFACSMGTAGAQPLNVPPNPQIEIQYVAPKNASSPLTAIYNGLKERKPLEELRVFLAPLQLPRKLKIQTDECGGSTVRPYEAGGDVTICYELVARLQQIINDNTKNNPDARYPILAGGFTQAILHELAHAIFDMLDVPIWGREEDAADQLGAFIMLQFGGPVAVTTIYSTAMIFQWSSQTWTGSDFASATSPAAQRFFNYVCIANGWPHHIAEQTIPKQLGLPSDLSKLMTVPAFRDEQCTKQDTEYQQMRRAFYAVVMPHVDPDMLTKVQAVNSAQWLAPGGAK